MKPTTLVLSLLGGALAIGCGSVDAAGNYTVSTANGANQCDVSGWTEGDTSAGIPVVITQDGDQVTIIVEGIVGGVLELAVGDNRFDGQVSGNSVTASLVGDATNRQDMCVYTYTVDLAATVDGDFIEGTLIYRPVTNGHADCGALETCEGNRQTFNGTRPPSG